MRWKGRSFKCIQVLVWLQQQKKTRKQEKQACDQEGCWLKFLDVLAVLLWCLFFTSLAARWSRRLQHLCCGDAGNQHTRGLNSSRIWEKLPKLNTYELIHQAQIWIQTGPSESTQVSDILTHRPQTCSSQTCSSQTEYKQEQFGYDQVDPCKYVMQL